MLNGVEIDEYVHRMGGVASWRHLAGHFPAAQVRKVLANGRLVKIGRVSLRAPADRDATRSSTLAGRGPLADQRSAAPRLAVKTPPIRPHVTVPRNRKVSPERRRGVELRYAEVGTEGVATTPVADGDRLRPVAALQRAISVADSALRSRKVREAFPGRGCRAVPAHGSKRCLARGE